MGAEDSPVKGRVLRVNLLCDNCYFLGSMEEDLDKYLFSHAIPPFISFVTTGEAATLVRLAGDGSPFEAGRPFSLDFMEAGSVVTDYFEFLVVIRDSPACEPLPLRPVEGG